MPLPLLALAVPAVSTAWAWVAGGAVASTAVAYHLNKKNSEFERGKRVGSRTAEALVKEQYERVHKELVARLMDYEGFEDKLMALYAVGLAAAASDGEICAAERHIIDEFVAGCMSNHLPAHLRSALVEIEAKRFKLTDALKWAAEAGVPRQDIDDMIDLVVHADGEFHSLEKRFVTQWQRKAAAYEQQLADA